MKTRNSLFLSLGLAFTAMLLGAQTLQAVVQPPDAGSVAIGGHVVTFVAVEYDAPQAGQSTWYYTVESGRQPSISHVLFEMLCPTIRILDAGTWNGTDLDSTISGAGAPEPGSWPASPKTDPTTKLTGLKFDQGFNDFQIRHYYFTVNDNYRKEPIVVSTKAGAGFDTGMIYGPSSDCNAILPDWAALGDRVWIDTNKNGLQDPGEPGFAGMMVVLHDEDGVAIRQTITDADGLYLFDQLEAGVYRVRFMLPKGYLFTQAYAGAHEVDSNADPETGWTWLIPLEAGERDLTIDAGLVEKPLVVRPILECVTANADGSYTAHFGYLNEGDETVTIPVGPNNKFVGGAPDRQPPTEFAPGRTPFWPNAAFSVRFNGDNLVWALNGRTSTASSKSTPCSYHVFLDKVWLDADGNALSGPPADLPADYMLVAISSLGTVVGTYEPGNPQLVVVYQNSKPALDQKGLWVPAGESYTIEEHNLPAGWAAKGLGEYFPGDGFAISGHLGIGKYYLHTVRNREDAPVPVPGLSLVKTGLYVPGTDPTAGTDCDVFGIARLYNAMIFGNFTAIGGDTEDRLAVAGDAQITTGYSVGYGVYGNPIPTYTGGTTDVFVVGNNLYDGVWGVNGNIVYGGMRSGPVRYPTNGNRVRHVQPVTFDANGNVPADGSGVSFSTLHARLKAASARLGALPDRGVVVKDDSQTYQVLLTGNDPVLNVFNLTAEEWAIASCRMDIEAPAGSTVLVNFHARHVNIENSSVRLTGVTREKVLFHFGNATDIAVSSFMFEGSVLAPYASAVLSGGSVNG
ncbi:MAG: choice-of-anchor A family protein, partial [Kiritimatiellia bacterium]|nr:choice-of-anchor A family protein [Kiritimatiellia bacterium]